MGSKPEKEDGSLSPIGNGYDESDKKKDASEILFDMEN